MYDSVLVILFGLVASGLAYSLWSLISGRPASFSLFWCEEISAPLRAMVVVVCAPVLLAQAGYTQLNAQAGLLMWGSAFATSLALCFIQGVVVVVCLGLTG